MKIPTQMTFKSHNFGPFRSGAVLDLSYAVEPAFYGDKRPCLWACDSSFGPSRSSMGVRTSRRRLRYVFIPNIGAGNDKVFS